MRDFLFAALLCAVAATSTATAKDYADDMARLRVYDDTVRPVIIEMLGRVVEEEQKGTD